jgi:hypothetical protein
MFSPTRNPKVSRALLSLGFFAGAVYLAYIMGQWVLNDQVSGLGMGIAFFCGLGVLLAILGRWRLGVFLLLVWLPLEDLVRKYRGNNMSVYFAKDLLAAVAYGAFLFAVMKRRERLFRPPFWLALVAFTALGVVQIFNPRSPSIFYGLLGVQMYFIYIPLLFLGYALVSDQDDLGRFLNLNLKIGCAVACVGIIQASGHSTFLNPANLAPAIQILGHLTRYAPGMNAVLQAPPSVFVSQGRYANYLELMFTVALGAAAFQLFRRRSTVWTYLALAVLAVAIFLSGSKGALVYSLITVASFGAALLWGVRGQSWISTRLGKIMRRTAIALAAGFCLFIALFPNLTSSWGQYYYELLWPDSAHSVLAGRIGSYPLSEFEKTFQYPHWATGYGTGTASLGGQYVTADFHAPPSPVGWVENGFGVILIEMGILGPILWIVMGGAIVISGWKLTRRLASTPLYPVALCFLWFAFWVFFPFTWGSMTTYQNFVVNAYLWLLVGILFRLPSVAPGIPSRTAAIPAVSVQPAEPVHAGQTP